jgi:hypothetical protein
MIRTACVVIAGALSFAVTTAAQPLSVPPTQPMFDQQTTGLPIASLSLAPESGQGPAHSFHELSVLVAVGDTVYVVDESGRETKGRVSTLSDAALALAVEETRREFAVDGVRRIDRRRRDSVRNGLLIGLGTGALVGFGLGRTADSPGCPRSGVECGQGAVVGTIGGALWGALGGWITDALIRKREVIYLAHNQAGP